jgi:hypothetical protein
MAMPIWTKFGQSEGGSGLRSNFWDDACEGLGWCFTSLGRAVVATDGEGVIGFCKSPFRLPAWTSRRADGQTRREVWCANSLGVVRGHRGRGLGRALQRKSHEQFHLPTLMISGHEVGNLASERMHALNGYIPLGRFRALHLGWVVYALEINN